MLFYYNTKETIISRSSVQRVTDLELQTLEIKKNSKLDLDININLKSPTRKYAGGKICPKNWEGMTDYS